MDMQVSYVPHSFSRCNRYPENLPGKEICRNDKGILLFLLNSLIKIQEIWINILQKNRELVIKPLAGIESH
jgi:hypothetical protein